MKKPANISPKVIEGLNAAPEMPPTATTPAATVNPMARRFALLSQPSRRTEGRVLHVGLLT